MTATFLVTPYAFNYDMVAFGWVMIKLMDRTDNDAWDFGLMLAVWTVPLLTVPMGIAGIGLSALPILTLGGKLLWRIWKSEPDLRLRSTDPTILFFSLPRRLVVKKTF